MKIIHYINSIDKNAGGTATFLKLLVDNISEKIDVLIVSGESPDPINISDASIRYFNLNLINLFSIGGEFSSYLKKEKPDLVHINGIWNPYNWLFQKEAQKLGITIVLSPHGMLEPYILNRNSFKKKLALLLYQKKAIKKANYIHSTAKSEFNQIRKLGFNQFNAIIPNGIDIQHISKKDNLFNLEKKNILFLSRVHPKKGINLLIDAVSQIENFKGNIIIAGEGEENYIKKLKQYSKDKEVSQYFSFLGGVYGDKKRELFSESDIFILPTYSENFGIVIVEALATGIPVITTQGTPWEQLVSHNCGWWIELNVENLISALNSAISSNQEELKEMGERGRLLVQEHYEIKKVSAMMMEFYQWVYNSKIKPGFIEN